MPIDVTARATGCLEAPAVHRPSGRLFLWYVLGGSLPERHWTWVLNDTTCRTWAIRAFARVMAILGPLFVVYVGFMPGSLGLRFLCGLTFSGGVLVFMFVNILVDNDRRAVRAGYASGHVSDIRSQRSDARHHLAVIARRERSIQRRERRNA